MPGQAVTVFPTGVLDESGVVPALNGTNIKLKKCFAGNKKWGLLINALRAQLLP